MSGNGDYISREAAIEYLTLNMGWVDEDGYPVDDWDERKAHIADLINGIPAADVRPVVRGEWVAEKEDVEWGCSTVRYRCSHCGRLPHFDKESFKFLLSDFCPNCGAWMEES